MTHTTSFRADSLLGGLILALLAVGGLSVQAAAQDAPLNIDQVRLGYDGRFRPGRMTPLFVRCVNNQPAPVNAQLRLIQGDQDGDNLEIIADAPLAAQSTEWRCIIFRPGDAAALREAKLVLGVADGNDFEPVEAVSLGEPTLRSLGSGQLRPLGPDEMAVGVIGLSAGVMNDIVDIKLAGDPQATRYQPFRCFTLSPDRLVGDWRALDFIDVLFWEDPDIAAMHADVQKALAQWVMRGGRLVMALGPHANELSAAASEFRRMLPVRVDRTSVPIEDISPLYSALGLGSRGRVPATICRMVRRRGDVVAVAGGMELLCRAPYVAGEVAVLAGRLEDTGLDAPTPDRGTALRSLLGFPLTVTQSQMRSLSTDFEGQLSQPATGGALVGLAVLLCLVYVLAAGPASWFLLRARKCVKYSWWLFGAVAVVASVAFTFLAMMRVTDTSVSAVMVLDMDEAMPYGSARGYCGVYMPVHGYAEVALARDSFASLSPMITESLFGRAGYTDVRKYAVRNDSPSVIEPFFRRTVKRFACNWAGEVEGSILGRLRLESDPDYADKVRLGQPRPVERWRLTGRVDNNFGVRLSDVVILYCQNGTAGLAIADLDPIKARDGVDFDSSLTRETRGVKPARVRSAQERFGSWLPQSMGMYGGYGGGPSPMSRGLDEFVLMASGRTLMDKALGTVSSIDGIDLNGLDRSSLLTGDYALLIARLDSADVPAPVMVDGERAKASGQVLVRMLLPLERSSPVTLPRQTVVPRQVNAEDF